MMENWLTSVDSAFGEQKQCYTKRRLTIFAREERFPFEHFRKDTPCTPDVNSHVVLSVRVQPYELYPSTVDARPTATST